MNDDIRRLARLQEIAFQIKELEQAASTLPKRIAELDQTFQQRTEEIGAARLKHESLVQSRTRLSQEREDQQARLKQAQQKLMQVNNQREYSAALNEIDVLKSAVSGLEDRILEAETQIEALAGPAAEADQRIGEERARVDGAKGELERETRDSAARIAELLRQREEIAAHLRPDLLRRFDSIFRARGGQAMARVEKESCGACHVRLRPQVINNARRGTELVTCESCRRILYVDDEREAAAEAPAAGDQQAGASH